MKISILHPSRGRPDKSSKTLGYWIDAIGAVQWEYILSCDSSDPMYGHIKETAQTPYTNAANLHQ